MGIDYVMYDVMERMWNVVYIPGMDSKKHRRCHGNNIFIFI